MSSILLKHTLRSISKNKLQATLIAATIVIVTVILFVALSISDIFYNIAANEYARIGVDADVMIGSVYGGETYAKGTVDNLFEGDDNVIYVRNVLRAGTVLRTENENYTVMVEATDLHAFVKTENGFHLMQQTDKNGYPGALVSQRFTDEYSLAIGDLIKLLSPISGDYITFRITHIFKSDGFFSGTTVHSVLVDDGDVGTLGLCNTTLIKLKKADNLQPYFDKVAAALPAISVGAAYPEALIASTVSQNTALFSVAIVFVVLLMLLILLTNYLIIARNRTNEMALFRAAGATPLDTAVAVLSEAATYGFAGALIGTILGRIVIGTLIENLIPYAAGAITFSLWKYALTFVLGALTSIISALIPAASLALKSVRELTEHGEKHTRYAKPWLTVLAAIGVVCFFIAMLLAPSKYLLYLFIGSAPVLVLFIITASPYIVLGMSAIGKKLFHSGPERIAANSVARNGALSSIATLIAVVISFSFLFTSVISVVIKGITPYATRFDADVVVTVGISDTFSGLNDKATKFSQIDGVAEATPYSLSTAALIVDEQDTKLQTTLFGITDRNALTKLCDNVDTSALQAFDETANPIIFNYDMAKRVGLDVGDAVSFYVFENTSTDRIVTVFDTIFTIVGFEYSEKEWNYTAIIKADNLTTEGVVVEQTGNVLISFQKSADRTAVFKEIRHTAESLGSGVVAMDFSIWAYSGAQDISAVQTLIKIVEAMFILVALLGVLNVLIVAVLDRSRELYLYKIYGMSLKDYYVFSATEGLLVSAAGGIIGLTIGLVFANVMPALQALIDKYYLTYALPWQLFAAVGIGISVFVALWMSTAIGNRNRYLEKRYGTERR